LRARNDTSFPADGHAVVSGATGWRRSDEGDNGVRQQHDKLTEFVDEAPLSVTMALPGLTATRTIARTAGGLDPAVDDVLDFNPAAHLPRDLRETVATPRIGHRLCVFDARAMHRGAGNLIVERWQADDKLVDQIHWAAGHSSSGPDNCDSAVDLVLSGPNLDRLSIAAGGWGIGRSSPVSGLELDLWHCRLSEPVEANIADRR
jgi:hypothetical protein